jgi:hypothetical protein
VASIVLPTPGRPDEQHVGLVFDEAQRGEVFDEPAIERGLG